MAILYRKNREWGIMEFILEEHQNYKMRIDEEMEKIQDRNKGKDIDIVDITDTYIEQYDKGCPFIRGIVVYYAIV